MSLVLSNDKIKAGVFIPVYNTERKRGENKVYYSLWVEDSDGGNERCILFTEREVAGLKVVSPVSNSLASKMKDGRLYEFGEGKSLVKVSDSGGENERVILIRVTAVEYTRIRASKNLEDLTKKGILTDLID